MKTTDIKKGKFPHKNYSLSGLRGLIAFTLPMVLLGAASCAADENGEIVNTGEHEARFTAGVEVTTRASEKSWDAGDRIGVFMIHSGQKLSSGNILNEVSNNVYVSPAGQNVSFTPADAAQRVFYPSDGSKVDFIAYYPYREAVVKHPDGKPVSYIYDVDLTDQSVPADIDLLFSNNAVYKDHKAGTVPLEFEHMLSRLQMNVIAGDGVSAADVAAMKIVVRGVPVKAEFSLTNAAMSETVNGSIEMLSASSGTLHRALMIPSPEGAEGRELIFTIPKYGDFSWEMPAAAKLLRGKTHSYNVTVTRKGIESVTEGEITEWTGKDDPAETGEALPGQYYRTVEAPNCYLVSPGQGVSISLEKVFALWENNPYLREQLVDFEAAPAVAGILWKDSQEVSAGVAIAGKSVEVEIDPASGYGNAVVFYSVDDVILWSWHIWVTDYDLSDESAWKRNNGYTFLDRNLGATSNVAGDFRTVGLYYQWGRKDPMIGAPGWSGSLSFAPVYDAANGQITRTTFAISGGGEDNYLAYSIQHPEVYLSSSIDWFSTTAGRFPDRWNGGKGFKSAFDPCPEGWRVPLTGAGEISPWYGVTIGTIDEYRADYGWNLEGIGYYPAGGYIQTSAANIYSVGSNVYYWSATPRATYAYYLGAALTTWNPVSYIQPGTGMPVRCVKQ